MNDKELTNLLLKACRGELSNLENPSCFEVEVWKDAIKFYEKELVRNNDIWRKHQ
jgi:hypothetical protein